MGVHSEREIGSELALRWLELCNDPMLHDLPGKVELNAYGVIELSPASTRHGRLQAALVGLLCAEMPDGEVLIESGILTSEGVRVPDVAWVSRAFWLRHGETTPLPEPPELCIEVRSPSNTDREMAFKKQLFLDAGAQEVWIVAKDGSVTMFDANGPRATSRYGVVPQLPPPVEPAKPPA